MNFAGRRVAVWGAARTGIAAANLLSELGADVVLSDTRGADAVDLSGLDSRVAFRAGGNVLEGAELVVPSPGIPPSAAVFDDARAAGARLMSEIELGALVATAPLVAITGTDGKSTTTSMIGAVVEAAGRPAAVAGNIGDSLSAHARDVGPDGVLVAEVSAFQLWSCGHFRPRVAVVTNVAEDHADYFEGDAAVYAAAKARVLRDQRAGDVAVLRADDVVVRDFATAPGVQRVLFAPIRLEDGWGFDAGWLRRDGAPIMRADELPVPGRHNVANALAALAAGEALGLKVEAMLDGLRRFRGLPHRLEPVRSRCGVDFYDDSKATNPHAAAVGLRSLDRTVVAIVGGFDKGLDQSILTDALVDCARHVVLVGGTADRTERELGGRVATTRVATLESAVEAAASRAQSGDAVVLSPGSSSFDLFENYHHRGEVFQAAVRALSSVGGAESEL